MADNQAGNQELLKFLETNETQGRTMLLPALIKTQNLFGFISEENARTIGQALRIPLADVTGVIEFYSMFYDHPVGSPIIRICTSPVCVTKGSKQLLEAAANLTELDQGDQVFVEEVACLGLCDRAPAALVDQQQIGPATINHLVDKIAAAPVKIYGQDRLLTQNCQPSSSPDLKEYCDRHGFKALAKVLSLSQEEVIEIVNAAGLRGRGGAGFPTGLKWQGAYRAPDHPKYIVCNLDESEPGTFKDQALILGDPFRILEGMLIAAYSVGAQKGFCYIRGEYPSSRKVFEDAISQAYGAGLLGNNILGEDFNFHLEIRSGAGAYICGEETALFESIEGKRGFPRIKPPFPTTHGLFGKPTVINNVETFANLPLIFTIGVDQYRKMGSESVPGPRLFSVSGDIAKPGVYECSNPITLRELLFDHAGGIPDGHELQGILLGGAAGKFIGPENLDTLLSEEILQQKGYSLGSGAIMVFDSSQDMREILASLGSFFAHESCGKCYPCQLGTQRQAEILTRNLNGSMLDGDKARLVDVGWTMTDASLCGLGQTAASAVLSALDLWPELFIEKGHNRD